MTWVQLVSIVMDRLDEKTQGRLMELAEDRPAGFVAITDGDESLIRDVDLESILSPEQLLDSIEDGDIMAARVIVSKDVYGHDLFIDNAYDVRKGYWGGEKTCYLEHGDLRA